MDTNSTYVVYIFCINTNKSPHIYAFGYTNDIEGRLRELRSVYGNQFITTKLINMKDEISARLTEVLFDDYCTIKGYKHTRGKYKGLFEVSEPIMKECKRILRMCIVLSEKTINEYRDNIELL